MKTPPSDMVLPFEYNLELASGLKGKYREISTGDLDWHLDYPFFNGLRLTPMAVMAAVGACMEHPELFRWIDPEAKKHMDKMVEADMFYPIKVVVHPTRGHYVVVEGLHRLMKAFSQEEEKVWVEIIDLDKLERIE